MAEGLSGYNITPTGYTGSDGIVFHLKDDMSVFLQLSATTDMSFSAPMQVSTQPVQTGQTVTDNVQESPQTIQINGVVVVNYQGAFLQTKNISIVEDFVSTLQRWRKQKQVLRVLCKDGITLESALCTSFEAKKDNKIANGLNISLTFQDVAFVAQIGRTQSPTANGQSSNANGSKNAKAKDGGVTGKKDVGKAGTKGATPRTPCEIVKTRESAGDTAAWLWKASVACDYGSSNSRSGITYNESNGAKYIPKSIYGSQGGNVNKIPKAG